MLIKRGNDLYRILELHHLTPGNKRAHIQVRMRNIRTMALADEKLRAEEDVERATLDEREMQYLYSDGDHYYFMDTSTYEQINISTSNRLASSCRRPWICWSRRPPPASRARPPARRSSRRRSRPAS
jgi:translation elongation factor P/translation initiation factor 5A